MGGLSFKDQPSTKVWVSLLGNQEVISYGFGMVVQMLALSSSLTTLADVTKASTDAIKASYGSTIAADNTASFSLPYPETIFRPSTKITDASRGGIVFTSAFSSPDVYDGDAEFSAKSQYLNTLSIDRDQNQTVN